MFESTGILRYGPDIRAIVEVDQGISDFYRKLIPKYHYAQPQMYKAHITFVRTNKESPTNLDAWGKYEGEEVAFSYSNELKTDGTYWYLNAWSDRIGDIREELGLPRYRFGELGSDKSSYHITVANSKDREQQTCSTQPKTEK